ncbi:MAG TPA: type II secretion system protein [Candidatus Paceibacterota bacterium]
MNQIKKRKSGFTIIELLVVVAIIGIMATVVIVALGPARTKARDARRVADIKGIYTAMQLYYADYGTFPDCDEPGYAGGCDIEGFGPYTGGGDTSRDVTSSHDYFLPFLVTANILSSSPRDPINDITYWYGYGQNVEFPAGSGQYYSFVVAAFLEDPNSPLLKSSITYGDSVFGGAFILGDRR